MSTLYGSIANTIRKVVGGFDSQQMIAIGVVALVAILLGFFIGACAMYAAGVKKGKLLGAKEIVAVAKEKAEEQVSGHKKALLEEKKKSEALRKEHDAALNAKQEAEEAALAAERSKAEAERIAREAEKAANDAKEEIRALRESEEKGDTVIKARKKKIELLSKAEILAYAEGLGDLLPTTVYARGEENLPDSCRVGICTYLLVYERKNMVKLVLRLHKKTAAALEKQFKLFTKAVYPKGGDWYRWILSSEVADLGIVTAAINMAYKYVYLSNYGQKGTDLKANLVNKEENEINASILKYRDLPDRDFIVASDAADGKAAFSLYGKKEMADYARTLAPEYPVTVGESESELSPSTFKVGGKAFLMAYEKDGVAKMVFRLSAEEFVALKAKHATADLSPFPKAKGYSWYVAYVDETFTSNAEIEDIIRSACAHVCGLTAE